MFLIITNVTIGKYKPFRASSLKWKWHLKEYVNTAFITIPTMCYIKRADGVLYTNLPQPSATAFTEGDPVQIDAYYNDKKNQQGGDKTITRFKGFVKRINFKVPLEIECEGYSYQLRNVPVNKIWKNTTIKKILQEITAGTDITLSKNIPDIPVDVLPATNCTAIDVLDYFKKKMPLTVYFNQAELYVGVYATNIHTLRKLTLADMGTTVKHKLGWNVIKDDELKFNADKEFGKVVLHGYKRLPDGTIVKPDKQPNSDLNVVNKKIYSISDKNSIELLSTDETNRINNKGYEGKMTTFLEPYAEPNWATEIDDEKYPARKGSYFISGVEGSVTKSGGGRQIIQIDFAL